jgi:hypothetical protein
MRGGRQLIVICDPPANPPAVAQDQDQCVEGSVLGHLPHIAEEDGKSIAEACGRQPSFISAASTE